jgi:hypothetical protein
MLANRPMTPNTALEPKPIRAAINASKFIGFPWVRVRLGSALDR